MTYRTRFVLFLFFIFLFLIIAPISIFYAAGYKINLSWPPKLSGAIQKMGMFVFDTEPEGAKIYINNEPASTFINKLFGRESYLTTPAKIKNIKSGEYQIKLEKDGYWPWEKKLEILSGKSTNAEDILLFKKSSVENIVTDLTENYLLSPDKKHAIHFSDADLTVIDLSNKSLLKISKPQSSKPIWSDDSQKFIAGNKIFLKTGQEESIVNLKNIENIDIKYFSPQKNLILYQEKNNLLAFDILTSTKKIILVAENIKEISNNNNRLNCLIENGGKNKITSLDTTNLEIKNEFILPHLSEYRIINSAGMIIVTDQKNQVMYFLNPDSADNKLAKTLNNAKIFARGSDNRFIYANDFEIWLFNEKSNQQTLLARLSNPINNIFWHESNNYIIFSTDKNINVLELDDREKRNIIELLSGDKINDTIINNNGLITIFGNINGINGWYNLPF